MTGAERLADSVTLYQGDCLEVLPSLAGIDAVITDPPYGMGLRAHGTLFRRAQPILGDESQEVGQALIDYCAGRGWPVAAFAHPLRPWRGDWRQALAWDKGGAVGIGGDRKTCWKHSWELIQISRRFGSIAGPRDESVLRFPMLPVNSKRHPAAKSIPLMRYLIRKLTPFGGTILDPFAGSGTTGLAAALEGRRAVLIEREPAYCDIIRRRVAESAGLFAGESK